MMVMKRTLQVFIGHQQKWVYHNVARIDFTALPHGMSCVGIVLEDGTEVVAQGLVSTIETREAVEVKE